MPKKIQHEQGLINAPARGSEVSVTAATRIVSKRRGRKREGNSIKRVRQRIEVELPLKGFGADPSVLVPVLLLVFKRTILDQLAFTASLTRYSCDLRHALCASE
jgi:hypothetical protein